MVCFLRSPRSRLRALLRLGASDMAAANWDDPGGWRSMVISYEGNPPKIADRILSSEDLEAFYRSAGCLADLEAEERRRRLAAGLWDDCILGGS